MNIEVLKTRFSESYLALRNNPIIALVLLCSILGFVQTCRFGGASLDYYFVKNLVDNWEDNIDSKTQDDYLRANKAIASAQSAHPTHPLYRDLQGQLLEWGALAGFEDEHKALDSAKSYYLNAIKLRPTWPVSYASLSVIKWRLGEFDDELALYLSNADKFGPLKAEVHILFVELGLALYSVNHPFYVHLQPSMKRRLSFALQNAQSRTRALESINSLGQKNTACRWMKDFDPYVHKKVLKCQ